jgi:hypothetical protein
VRAGWSGDVGELVDQGGDGVAVAFEGLAFVVGGVDLFERGRPSGAAGSAPTSVSLGDDTGGPTRYRGVTSPRCHTRIRSVVLKRRTDSPNEGQTDGIHDRGANQRYWSTLHIPGGQ